MINIKWEGIEQLQAALDPKIVIKAVVWALNRTAKNAITAADKKVREINAIKKKDIKKTIKTKKATNSNQEVVITLSGQKIPIISFKAKQTRRGVTFRVKSREKRKLIPHAFKTKMRFNESVFLRESEKRHPVRELRALSIVEMFEADAVMDVFEARVIEQFPKNFDSRYKFLVDRETRRVGRRAARRR